MNKVQLLLDVVNNLRSLADSLSAMTDSIGCSYDGCDMSDRPTSNPAPQSRKPQQPTVTLEQVRAVLADKSRNGKTAAVRELLKKHGVDRLSAVRPDEYPALLTEAEGL